MPPGNTHAKAPAKVVEKVTVEACIAIAQRVQRARCISGDQAGSEAANQIAEVMREELLR
ncbi:hypothetical protein [Geothrix campi]|jgi:hypothetical protein|uniref:hypothetical protein n=1 Tax=Geothrix campi TaxID=2966450 RepID=UPI0021498C02|nr:hypothetical protein [Geothrix sp. SG10]